MTAIIAETCDPPEDLQAEIADLFAGGRFDRIAAKVPGWIERYPNSPLVWKAAARSFARLGQSAMAAKCFGQSLQLDPNDLGVLQGLADILKAGGQYTAAEALYKKALTLSPNHIPVLNNLANAYRDAGRLDEASQTFEMARRVGDHRNLDVGYLGVLLLQNRLAEAEQLVSALDLERPDKEILTNVATFYQLKGDLPEAASNFERAARLDGSDPSLALSALSARRKMGDWNNLTDTAVSDLLSQSDDKAAPLTALTLTDNPSLQRSVSERCALSTFPKVQRHSFTPPSRMPEKLNIGYFSSDFYGHATMHLMRSFFTSHSKDKFQVFVYSYGSIKSASLRRFFEENGHLYRDVSQLSDAQIAQSSRQDDIHVAIDLKGYTGGTRASLFAHGAAPVQVSWIGYPGTTGHPCFDYAIVDPVVVPSEARDSFSESLIFMPHSYQVNDNTRPRATAPVSREAENLPEGAFVFSCFNGSQKISEREFDIWMRVLKARPESVLWLLENNEWFPANMRSEARARGVDPDRLVFAPFCSPDHNLAR